MYCYLMEVFPEDHALDPFTEMLDNKFEFAMFDFSSEDAKRNNYIERFNEKLKNQITKKQR